MRFWRPHGGGSVLVAVKVHPRSRRPGIGGRAPDVAGERLRIGVSEAAEDGRANRAACAVLAAALGVRQAEVSVAAGATSRDKTLLVMGDAGQLAARLEAL
jgi:uncharacterized protein YggU (UPF0235/DUF167 family)